ncbi:MAG: methylated-DNA--[protein]-cysteine S-methyltransferase [Desulfobacteraceae bacterium]|nr:methylated-DNA--[protein]-cysteine S-methyltransferase [Desulfobacteraceae bacterium]
MKYRYITSQAGLLMLTGSHKLERIYFPKNGEKKVPNSNWVEDNTMFSKAVAQLNDYFNGGLKAFDLESEIDIQGTYFQRQVWQELVKIPYGTTTTYGEIATRIDNPNASRAVGFANGKNMLPIIIPCHRVIGKNGSLTGFAGGLNIKQILLELESSD